MSAGCEVQAVDCLVNGGDVHLQNRLDQLGVLPSRLFLVLVVGEVTAGDDGAVSTKALGGLAHSLAHLDRRLLVLQAHAYGEDLEV